MTWDIKEEYFSGQGSVLVGTRNAAGKVQGLRHIGNVTALTLSTAKNYALHRESKSGKRGVDRRRVTETNVTFAATCENFDSENLQLFMHAILKKLASGQVSGLTALGRAGLIVPLDHVKVSDVVVKFGAKTLTAYVDDATAFDYEVNAGGGSIRLNRESPNLAHTVTDLVPGTTTTITVEGLGLSVGDQITLDGFTGADAADVNGKTVTITAVTPTGVIVGLNTTGKTIEAATGKVYGGILILSIDYAYESQDHIEALAGSEKEVFIRFEGLNTSEEDAPVTVDVFRISTQPIADLALISDEIQAGNLQGEVLADNTRPKGTSQYYVIRK